MPGPRSSCRHRRSGPVEAEDPAPSACAVPANEVLLADAEVCRAELPDRCGRPPVPLVRQRPEQLRGIGRVVGAHRDSPRPHLGGKADRPVLRVILAGELRTLLIVIDSHEHGDPREKMPCPLDDVEMTGCDGVEGAGIDRMLSQPAPLGRIEHRPRLGAISSAELTSTIELKHDGRAQQCGPFRRAGDGRPALARGAGITRRGWPRLGPVSRIVLVTSSRRRETREDRDGSRHVHCVCRGL